jgi:hypothetical protein
MPTSSDHNKILSIAAKKVLIPLGCKQKGRSRLWYDDHGWWVTVIEFQPSDWGQGSYLNVGAMWLWFEEDYWSFDEGYRVEAFSPFKDESQFSDAATRLAERAAAEVLRYRAAFPTVNEVASFLRNKEKKGNWGLYHAAVASGLSGSIPESKNLFAELLLEPPEADWHRNLQTQGKRLQSGLSDTVGFRRAVTEVIQRSRHLHKLSVLEDPWTYVGPKQRLNRTRAENGRAGKRHVRRHRTS